MRDVMVTDVEHEFWMHRCLELALRGQGRVSPNPMVGAVLVRGGVVLAEGWHDVFGGAHAERMLFEGLSGGLGLGGESDLGGELDSSGELDSVAVGGSRASKNGGINYDFSDCILYVSLEPCAHFGKTPPCANLILKKGVGRVVVGVLDPNPLVGGKGVEILRAAGVEVLVGVLADECRLLNWAFWVNQVFGRTAVVAKWAETGDGFMGGAGQTDRITDTKFLAAKNQPLFNENPTAESNRVLISGEASGKWVHHLRSGMDAILVGVNTWNLDKPKLDVRGAVVERQPVRIVLDRNGRGEYTVAGLSRSEGELWVIGGDLELMELLKWLYREKGLGVILVEGGAEVLSSFFDADCLDQVHVLRNAAMVLGVGIKSPDLAGLELRRVDDLGLDEHWIWERHLG